jgi:hypothetical protein
LRGTRTSRPLNQSSRLAQSFFCFQRPTGQDARLKLKKLCLCGSRLTHPTKLDRLEL